LNYLFRKVISLTIAIIIAVGLNLYFKKTKEERDKHLKESTILKDNTTEPIQAEKKTSEIPNTYNQRNIQSFELNTKKGIVKLHTYMSKDSVKILMGHPHTTNIDANSFGAVMETWKYMGRNSYVEEFTIEFVNGELKSVKQFRENY